jgi:flagellar biosynthesis/type III secretory pathway protein FliH
MDQKQKMAAFMQTLTSNQKQLFSNLQRDIRETKKAFMEQNRQRGRERGIQHNQQQRNRNQNRVHQNRVRQNRKGNSNGMNPNGN